MLEHYPDAVRQEHVFWSKAQQLYLDRRGWKPVDWSQLDRIEDERWGGAEGRPAPKTQREMLQELRAKAKIPSS